VSSSVPGQATAGTEMLDVSTGQRMPEGLFH